MGLGLQSSARKSPTESSLQTLWKSSIHLLSHVCFHLRLYYLGGPAKTLNPVPNISRHVAPLQGQPKPFQITMLFVQDWSSPSTAKPKSYTVSLQAWNLWPCISASICNPKPMLEVLITGIEMLWIYIATSKCCGSTLLRRRLCKPPI